MVSITMCGSEMLKEKTKWEVKTEEGHETDIQKVTGETKVK